MTDLADQSCESCRGGGPPIEPEKIGLFLEQVPAWEVVENHHLRRRFELRNFEQALSLANRFGEIAEEQGHHPVLSLSWGWLEVTIWTHKVDGLTLSDFVLAAHFDRAQARASPSSSPSAEA